VRSRQSFGTDQEGREIEMAITLKEKMKGLSAGRRKKVRARAQQLIAKEMTMQEMRRARKMTQIQMAKEIGITQNGVHCACRHRDR